MPNATLHEVPAGHGPWLVDADVSAKLIEAHIAGTAGVR